jgi:hypothetical protein
MYLLLGRPYRQRDRRDLRPLPRRRQPALWLRFGKLLVSLLLPYLGSCRTSSDLNVAGPSAISVSTAVSRRRRADELRWLLSRFNGMGQRDHDLGQHRSTLQSSMLVDG